MTAASADPGHQVTMASASATPGGSASPGPMAGAQVCAAIDIGSNTIRLLVAVPTGDGLAFLFTRLETTRLAAGLRNRGSLDRTAAEASRVVLRSYLEDAERHRAAWVVAVGTAALRDARDGVRFVDEVRRETGLAVTIIDQPTEALLTLRGVTSVLGEQGALAAADLGGRSTEVILRPSAGLPVIHGFRLGAVNLGEDFITGDPPDGKSLRRLRRHLAAALASSSLPHPLAPEFALAGCGGTLTTLAALDLGLGAYDRQRINGHRLTRARVEELLRTMVRLDARSRAVLPGMAADRADIIIPGTMLASALLDRLGRRELVVSDAGILEGCILAALAGDPPLERTPIASPSWAARRGSPPPGPPGEAGP